jgi:hypothetical protein
VCLTLKQALATAEEFTVMCDMPYHEAIGMLNWAMLAMHPDITFVVSTVAHFATNPSPPHWDTVKHIFCYLAGTCNLWLSYSETKHTLEGYVDADGSMTEDHHTVSGYAFLIDGGAVLWSSKKQELVFLSTTESEYVTATYGMKEVLWLCSLLGNVFTPVQGPTTLFLDNQSMIALTKDYQYHPQTKYINIHYHFIHWVVKKGSLWLVYCPVANMVTDALTKALPFTKVKHFVSCLGLCCV